MIANPALEFMNRRIVTTDEPRCVCLEYIGDNGFCPIHGNSYNDNAVISAINEDGADDKPEISDLPAWMQEQLDYGDCNLEARHDEILKHYKEATPEEQEALREELAELEQVE